MRRNGQGRVDTLSKLRVGYFEWSPWALGCRGGC